MCPVGRYVDRVAHAMHCDASAPGVLCASAAAVKKQCACTTLHALSLWRCAFRVGV